MPKILDSKNLPSLVYGLGGRSYGRTNDFCSASLSLLVHLNADFPLLKKTQQKIEKRRRKKTQE
jgi:hypothetical protein